MKALLIFWIWCIGGTITEADGTTTELMGEGEFVLDYQNGVYFFKSVKNDSLFFYIEDGFYYDYGDSTTFRCLTN